MAVRNFDVTSSSSARYAVAPPRRRADVRRTKQRWAVVAVAGVTMPFVAVLVVLGVAH